MLAALLNLDLDFAYHHMRTSCWGCIKFVLPPALTVQAGDQTHGHQQTFCCRSQGYAAHVRIASQDNVMQAEDLDEILSFGTYPSADQGAFQPHASLTAQANGSLIVKAAGLNLLPAGGQSSIGSGKPLCKHA